MPRTASISHLPAADQEFILAARKRRAKLARDLAASRAARRARLLAEMPAQDRAAFAEMMDWR